MACKESACALVVAADPDLRELLSHVLTQELAITVISCDYQEAGQQVIAFKPSLVILDMPLPRSSHLVELDMPAWATLATQAVTVVALAALPVQCEMALQMGCADCIVKPFELDALFEMVTRHLPRRLAG